MFGGTGSEAGSGTVLSAEEARAVLDDVRAFEKDLVERGVIVQLDAKARQLRKANRRGP